MIRSFKDKETELIFNRTFSARFPRDIQKVAFRKLRMLSRAVTLNDMRVPPANHLEALRADRQGQHSVRINDRWRICFTWKDGDSHNVEIVDYH